MLSQSLGQVAYVLLTRSPLTSDVQAHLQFVRLVHDDLDLPVGKIRLRQSGSCGGQNGMRNIIDLLGDSNIKRIRVGIGKDPLIPVVDYVLGKTKKEDLEVYNQALDKASDALIYWLDHDDFSKVMSNFN